MCRGVEFLFGGGVEFLFGGGDCAGVWGFYFNWVVCFCFDFPAF